jgi:tRNA(Ile)-lysidine synthase
MPPHHPSIARALGVVREALAPLDDLREHGELRLLVACSGGPDSMALLGLLELLAHGQRLHLSVGHVDHGLRPDSADDAALVAEVAATREITLRSTRLSIEPGPGLSARAREARHAALRAQAASVGARAIALGHTATDQAETVLLHLARGAGLDGLSAMPPWEAGHPRDAESIARVRPLLAIVREEARSLCEHLGLPFVDDPTNEDDRAPRIAVRRKVLPVLRQLNPSAELALAAVADRARQADDALTRWIERELRAREIPAGWSVEGMSALPAAVRRGVVRAVCQRAGVPADALGRNVMDAIDRAVCHPGAPHGWDLRGGRRLRLRHQVLWLEPTMHPEKTRPQGQRGESGC